MTDSAGVCKEPPLVVPTVNPVTHVPNATYGYTDGAALPCAPAAASFPVLRITSFGATPAISSHLALVE